MTGVAPLNPCCRRCDDAQRKLDVAMFGFPMRVMIVCTDCGNKRCPHATDHRLACTRSNEPGQPGSDYP